MTNKQKMKRLDQVFCEQNGFESEYRSFPFVIRVEQWKCEFTQMKQKVTWRKNSSDRRILFPGRRLWGMKTEMNVERMKYMNTKNMKYSENTSKIFRNIL